MSAPAVDYANNGVAVKDREVKARKIALWCWTHGVAPERVGELDDALRRRVARSAGVNPPSTWDTWAVVVRKLEHAESDPSRLPVFGVEQSPEWLTTETDPAKKISSATPKREHGCEGVAAADGAVWAPLGWAELVASGRILGHGRGCTAVDGCTADAVAATMTKYRCAGHPPQPGEWGANFDWAPTDLRCAPGRCYCGACPSHRLAATPSVPVPREQKKGGRR